MLFLVLVFGSALNILEALDDENLFKPHFVSESWNGWKGFLAALFALPAPDMAPPRLMAPVRAAQSRQVRHSRKRLLSSAGAAANPASWL
jgi:hypothetical protein